MGKAYASFLYFLHTLLFIRKQADEKVSNTPVLSMHKCSFKTIFILFEDLVQFLKQLKKQDTAPSIPESQQHF